MCALAQDAVEHRDRGQIAGPHPEEGIPRGLLGYCAIGRPQPLTRRVQELLPRLRAGRVAEHRVIVALAQAIVPGTDVDTPTLRQIVGRSQLGEDYRIIRQRGPDHAVSAVDQRGHELLQSRGVDHRTSHGPIVPRREARCTVLGSHR